MLDLSGAQEICIQIQILNLATVMEESTAFIQIQDKIFSLHQQRGKKPCLGFDIQAWG